MPSDPGWGQNLLQPLLERLLRLELPPRFGSELLWLREVISEIMRQPWPPRSKNVLAAVFLRLTAVRLLFCSQMFGRRHDTRNFPEKVIFFPDLGKPDLQGSDTSLL